MYKKNDISLINGNFLMELSAALIFSRRTIGIFYLCFITLLINIIIKYVIKLFIVFCVVYTSMDLYKRRRKYLWIIRMINGNVKFILYSVIGEERFDELFLLRSKKIKQKSKKKN